MEKTRRRQNRITAVFLCIFVTGLIFSRIQDDIIKQFGRNADWIRWIQPLLYLIFLVGWSYFVRIRIIQKGIRRHLIAIAEYLVFWILVRSLKYYAVLPYTHEARYLWYLYYFPMLSYPVAALLAVRCMGERDDFVLPRRIHLFYAAAGALAIFVLTNDFHELVFRFPQGVEIANDTQYAYGWGYGLVFVWFMGCILMIFYQMFRKCRLPGRGRRLMFPMIPLTVGLVYIGCYNAGIPMFPDLTVTMSFLTISCFELAIRVGLIRSNTGYSDMFQQTAMAAQIVDKELQVQYVSVESRPMERNLLENVTSSGTLLQGDQRLSAAPIRDGYVIWQEDVSALLRVREELESANDYLEGRNTALNNRYITGVRRHRLEEQNRLYNSMQNESAEKLQMLQTYIRMFEDAQEESEQEKILLSMGIICAYLKRRNNLIFLAEEKRMFPTVELKNCLQEISKMLKVFGIDCQIRIESKSKLSFHQILSLYDGFEEVIERTAAARPSYYITLGGEEQEILRIRIAGIHELPELSSSYLIEEQEEEAEYRIQVMTEMKEVNVYGETETDEPKCD